LNAIVYKLDLGTLRMEPPVSHMINSASGQTPSQTANQPQEKRSASPVFSEPLFENLFSIEDLMVFDDAVLQRMLSTGCFGLTVECLARSLHGVSASLIKRIEHNLSSQQRSSFIKGLQRSLSDDEIETARRQVLDGLFWELTYWKTPDLYDELTEGEQLHPGIFEQLEQDLRGKVVLDAGAGTGRASFESLCHGAKQVYAVEPSPGLLRILRQKLASQVVSGQIVALVGYFDKLPLGDDCVDVALSCSAFTAEPGQGGESGLVELRRVTKRGGKIVIIWPRTQDYEWLASHGFQYVALPMQQDMQVHFRSLASALRCAKRFYAHNENVIRYILKRRQPEVPFSVLGFNPPRDYCWLRVE
jgi:ubiquinone/menaquinone biosynthesis C-methylase UbiE